MGGAVSRHDEAKRRLNAAWGAKGYFPLSVHIERAGIGWRARGVLNHPAQSYRTVTGISTEFFTDTWGLTLKRLVRRVEKKVALDALEREAR
jgi:hypothetical protein